MRAPLLALGLLLAPAPAQQASDDMAWAKDDWAAARRHYEQAETLLAGMALTQRRLQRTTSRTMLRWHEYVYGHLYDSPQGALLEARDLAFLRPKLQLCKLDPRQIDKPRRPVIYKVAAVVIGKTDLSYQEDGQIRRERNELDAAERARYRATWRQAMAILEHEASYAVDIVTDWVELDEVTLTGLTDSDFKGVVRSRHLDPARLVPQQGELFARLVKTHDCIVFVWDRGKAARSFGGGAIRLPGKSGRLPLRGSIRSMPPRAGTCIHEFLHVLGRKAGLPPVFGPRGNWLQAFAAAKDASDWYLHLIRQIKDWRKTKYLR